MSLHILAKFALFYVRRAKIITFHFGARKVLECGRAPLSHLEQEQDKSSSGAGKATKYLSAESGDVSESEIEIGRKSKIPFQEKPSMT